MDFELRRAREKLEQEQRERKLKAKLKLDREKKAKQEAIRQREAIEAVQRARRLDAAEAQAKATQQIEEELLAGRGVAFSRVLEAEPYEGAGDKIKLPPSCFTELSDQGAFDKGPLHFRVSVIHQSSLSNLKDAEQNKRTTHAGVLEFTADDGVVGLPSHIWSNLYPAESPMVPMVEVCYVWLLKGTYAKLQPVEAGFSDIPNHKAVLETSLRQHATLSEGDVLTVNHGVLTYHLRVLELKPSSSVSVLETDIEVDVIGADPTAESTSQPVLQPLELGKLDSGVVAEGSYVYYKFQIGDDIWGKISSGDAEIEKQSKNVPEAAGAWPIIGHLHLLNGPQMPHKIFGQMAEKYGPIFRLKLGVNDVVIVSDHKIAKECFTTNDKAFANRPKSIASEILGYNYAMFGLGPYGPYWREIRKIVTTEFLSARRIEMLKHVREFEVKSAVKETYEYWLKNNLNGAVKIEMKEWFGNLIMNTMVKLLFGVQYTGNEDEERSKAHKAIQRLLELLGAFVVADFLPYLRWLDIGGHEKIMKATAKEIDFIVEDWLAEHRRKTKLMGNNCGDEEDFMDVMLSICEDKNLHGFDTDAIIKATCMALQTAGTDTTIVTLIWILSLLLNNYEALKKAQDELDTHIGKNRWVQESDIKNLVYLQAIVKESFRLYPAAPLMLPHESIEDCVVSGYDIPKGTRLLVNVWKLQYDPEIWPNPHEFKPERFLTTHKDVDVRGNHFELIPFGSGRRMCPGVSLALQVLQYVVSVLLQGFDIKRPSDEAIDMSESFGLTILKASPLEVHLTPRLDSNLYYE